MKNLTFFMASILFVWVPGVSQGRVSMQNETGRIEGSNQQRKDYQKEIENELRNLDREIASLKAKAPKEGREVQSNLSKHLTELDEKREVVQQKFENLKNSSQRAWRDMKPDLNAAIKDLERAYKRAVADFK